mgnify:CR=1 FL=1
MVAIATRRQGQLWGVTGEAGGLPAGPGSPRPPMALLRAHICTSRSQVDTSGEDAVIVPLGGSAIRVASSRSMWGSPRHRKGGGKRGRVKRFTESSRRRLREVFSQIDQSQVVNTFFGTLTCRPISTPKFGKMFRAYVGRLMRSIPGRWSMIWRLEFHKSGAPHVHFMMYWRERSPKLPEMRRRSDLAWAGICAKSHGDAAAGRVQLNFVGPDGRAAGYTCKSESYVSKLSGPEEVEGVGRWWGVLRGSNLPVRLAVVRISPEQRNQFTRILRRFASRRSRVAVVEQLQQRGDSPPRWYQVHRENAGDFPHALRKKFRGPSGRAFGTRSRVYGRSYQRTETIPVWGRVEGTGQILPLGTETITESCRVFPVSAETSRRLLAWVVGRDLIADAESASVRGVA